MNVLQQAKHRYLAALAIACFATALCLFVLPVSLRFSAPMKKDLLREALQLADYRKPPPPPPKKQEAQQKKPEAQKVQPKLKSFMPKMDMDSSALAGKFQFDLGLAGGTGAGMGINLGAKIFDESKVDAKPVALFRTQPVYPAKAQGEQLTGRVSFRFLVDRDGMVKDVEIASAQPPGIFDDATIAAVKQWRFQPAKVKGEAVACWCQSSIKYELDVE